MKRRCSISWIAHWLWFWPIFWLHIFNQNVIRSFFAITQRKNAKIVDHQKSNLKVTLQQTKPQKGLHQSKPMSCWMINVISCLEKRGINSLLFCLALKIYLQGSFQTYACPSHIKCDRKGWNWNSFHPT